jgi:hypothetical protein
MPDAFAALLVKLGQFANPWMQLSVSVRSYQCRSRPFCSSPSGHCVQSLSKFKSLAIIRSIEQLMAPRGY